MRRIGARHLGVGGRRGFVVAHFILDVAQGREQGGIVLASFDGSFQQPRRHLQFALEVQGDGFRERTAGAFLLLAVLN